MDYLTLKSIHILSSILLFGTGLGSAFYKYFADRSGNVAAIAITNRLVVWADWLFTTPTMLIQPLSGFLLLHILGFDWGAPWVVTTLVLYTLAGGCWLPVVWLQIRMREISNRAVEHGEPLAPIYHRYRRIWFWLGVPAFVAMVAIVLLMVFKPTL
ncbi:DUF2269 family protein [Thiorhodovibrio frisius]|uniref:Putative integral membrane protein n=1 Tax=Thiorhodovibrio frisius TaxID=631362 RepID=H8Z2E5_9GAMM|nr:DUF2269 domain-containing protein [Thiorhodovibrio frisius]EIC21600.1 putative integral membrane protein [Thiorhodovibrio frisius]WPL21567.1 putative integral membrane protein [Thiorhodovibrio frisius]